MEMRQKIRGQRAAEHRLKTDVHDAVLDARRFDAAGSAPDSPPPAAAAEGGGASSSSPSLGSPKRSPKKKAAATLTRL